MAQGVVHMDKGGLFPDAGHSDHVDAKNDAAIGQPAQGIGDNWRQAHQQERQRGDYASNPSKSRGRVNIARLPSAARGHCSFGRSQ